MITAFIDMVGLLMLIPILPFYAKDMGANGFVVGLLVSSFAVAQLASAPIWGRFSDHHGRRPALLIGLTSAALAYVLFAFADALWLLFLSRLVQGAGGGTVSVIQAYVADTVEPKDRAKALGWLSAATNAGVALGPVLGSFASVWGRHAPGLIAAGLCLINILFVSRFLKESRDMVEARAHAHKRTRSHEALRKVVTHPDEAASRLIWIYAIAMGAFHGVNAILALFLADRYGVTAQSIGIVFMYIGTIAVVTRAFVLGWAVDTFGEQKLSRIGAALLAVGLAAMPFMPRIDDVALWTGRLDGVLPDAMLGIVPFLPLAIPVGLLPLGTAFTFPCVTAMLSKVVSTHDRGLYMGVQQTFGGIARVVFPIAAGLAFDWILEVPFLVGGALVAGTIVLSLGMDDGRQKPSEAVTGRQSPSQSAAIAQPTPVSEADGL